MHPATGQPDDLIRLSLVASANDNGVIFVNAQGEMIWANESFYRLSGFTPEDVIGKSPLKLYNARAGDQEINEILLRAFLEARSFRVELLHYHKDGTTFWARVQGKSILNAAGKLDQYFIIVEDIRQAKQQEEQLKVLSRIAEDNVQGVIIADADGRVTWVNQSFTRITGYTLEEARGQRPSVFWKGASKEDQAIVASIAARIKSGEPFDEEVLHHTKDGRPYWVRIIAQATRDARGKITGFFALLEDITKQKYQQKQLQEFEQRFRFVFEKLGDNVWEHDFRTNHTYFSNTESHLLGYNFEELEDNHYHWWNLVHEDDRHLIVDSDAEYRAGGRDHHVLEYRMRHRDGSMRWVLDRGVVIERDVNGVPLKIIGSHTDITRIKQTELELKQLVNKFRSLSENIPGVIYEYQFLPDGREGFRYISPALEKIFGISPDAFYAGDPFLFSEDVAEVQRLNAEARSTLQPFYCEARIQTPRGVRWHSVSSAYSYTTDDGAIVFTGFMADITERRQAEDALRMKEEKYRSIISNMNLGLLDFDTQGRIRFANQRFCLMSGYDAATLEGREFNDLFSPSPSNMNPISPLTGYADAYEIMVTNRAGERRWWLISGAARYNLAGDWDGAVGIHLDITPQKELEAELIRAREQAESSATAKQLFLANMSHEIRTPLNGILGMGYQLYKTNLTDEQRFFLDTITSASENLLVIVNDILDVSKIEAGKLTLESVAFEARPVILKALQVLMFKAEEKSLALTSQHFDPQLSPVLVGDPYRLNQILLNLLGNAIKFTHTGHVDLSCAVVHDGPDYQRIRFMVTDTGIGMEPAFVARLFDKFSQEDASITRQYGGTGLGMSICKNLVEMMGGTIAVTSEKGKGTVVSFEIPLRKGSAADLPAAKDAPTNLRLLRGRRILVADDNRINRLVAQVMLTNAGLEVREAVDGQEALAFLRREPFDLVLLDINMPVMDGVETVREIRRSISATMPVIALTANAFRDDHLAYLEAGMNECVAKPFKEKILYQVLLRWLVGTSEPATAQTTVTLPESSETLPTSHNNGVTVSLQRVREIGGNNEEFTQAMMAMFVRDTPVQVGELQAAWAAGDLQQMGFFAHKMKSNLDVFSLHRALAHARRIEVMARNGQADDDLPVLIREIAEDVMQAARVLAQPPTTF